MMDAPVPTDVIEAGTNQPSIWITRDAATMRLERQRAGGWPEAEILAHQATMRAAFSGGVGARYFVEVDGTFHSNVMDIPSWSPITSQLGISGPINGQRAQTIINAYSLAFFDRHLRGRSATLLDGRAAHYPEVVFESRGRSCTASINARHLDALRNSRHQRRAALTPSSAARLTASYSAGSSAGRFA